MLSFKDTFGIAIGLALLGGCHADGQYGDLDAYRAELASIEDRDLLEREIIANAEQMIGDEAADAPLWARLAVIEERVDQLDGLIHLSRLPDGSRLKFYERHPGDIAIAFFGGNANSDASMMDGEDLSAIEIFKRAQPNEPVPQALIDAEARAVELDLPLLTAAEHEAEERRVGLPSEPLAEAEGGSLTQHHEVRRHGTVTAHTWASQHCGPYNTSDCLSNARGPQTRRYPLQQRVVDWLYMLNTSMGPGLGSLLVAQWEVHDNASPFSESYGPWYSETGEMVKFRTGGRRYKWEDGTACWILACAVYATNRVATHDFRVTLHADNRWHMAATGYNYKYSYYPSGNIALP